MSNRSTSSTAGMSKFRSKEGHLNSQGYSERRMSESWNILLGEIRLFRKNLSWDESIRLLLGSWFYRLGKAFDKLDDGLRVNIRVIVN